MNFEKVSKTRFLKIIFCFAQHKSRLKEIKKTFLKSISWGDGGKRILKPSILNLVKSGKKRRLRVLLGLRIGEGVCLLRCAICEQLARV